MLTEGFPVFRSFCAIVEIVIRQRSMKGKMGGARICENYYRQAHQSLGLLVLLG
jgi:hypothetical protein